MKKYKKEYYKNNFEKSKEKNKKWRENNYKQRKEYRKKHYQNNKEKYKAANYKRRTKMEGNGGYYTTEQWEECLKFFNYKCCYTGEPMKKESKDHIIPITKGGLNYIWNIVPCELSLNKSKNNKDLLEWYKEQEFYSEERLNKIYEYIEYMKNKYELKEVI